MKKSKFLIPYKGDAKTVPEALGVSEERSEELIFRMDLIIHEIFRPTKDQTITIESGKIFIQFLSLAENQAEAIWLAYVAGMKIEELIPTEDFDREDDE